MTFRRAGAILVVLACIFVESASAQSDLPRVALRGTPLADALQLFVEATGESVAYDPGLVRDKVSYCVAAPTGAEALLRCLLEGTGLEYFRRGSGTYVVGPLLELPPAYGILTGRVVERDTGAPLPGASVLLADAGRGTAADASGRFALDRLLPGRYALTITHVGFAPWRDSLVVGPGGRTSVNPSLDELPLSISPLVIEADRAGGDPWRAADEAASVRLPRQLDRASSLTTRLADRAGVSLSDVTSDIRVQGGSASDVALRVDGVPVFVPRSIAGFVGTLGASALDQITVYGAGYDASMGGTAGSVIDFRHALSGAPGLDVQIDPYAASARIRMGSAGAPDRLQGLVSVRHGLGSAMLPPALDRMLRSWSGPDPFLLVAPLRRYDLATTDAIGYATGLFVPADPALSFDDLHVAGRYRPRPTVSWDASLHVGARSVAGNRLSTARFADNSANDRPLFSSSDVHDWTTRMVQLRHERVIATRYFLTTQVWATQYDLDHRYRLADRIGLRAKEDTAISSSESASDASRDGNSVDAVGLSSTLAFGRGRHAWTVGLEVSRTASRFDLRMASVSAGDVVDEVVAGPDSQGGIVLWDTTTVFRARHAQVVNRADQFLSTIFASDRVTLGRLTLEPGLRLTLRPDRSTVYAEPRLRAAWSGRAGPLGRLSITAASGLYRQFLNQYDVSSLNAGAFFPSTRIWLPLDESLRPSRSLSTSFSVSVAPSRSFSVVADGWLKDLRHATVFNYDVDPSLLINGAELPQATLLTGARGVDRGLGIAAGYETRTWTARVRYERSVSWRRSEGLFDGRRVSTAGHAPHRWSVSMDAAPLPALDFGLRAVTEIGRKWAFRQVYYDYFGHDPATAFHAGYDFSDPDAHRLPAIVTLDATMAWTHRLGPARLQIRGEVRNVLNRANELDRQLLWNGDELVPVARLYPGRTVALALRVVW